MTHVDQEKLTLKPIDMKLKTVIIYKCLACLSLLWTLLVLSTETALIFGPEYTLINLIVSSDPDQTIKIFIISVMFLSGITLICFFAIFNLKLSDYLQLREGQTDCIQMASITGLCAKIINVICFNYMVICGEVMVPNGS